jgi:hypothetical protein
LKEETTRSKSKHVKVHFLENPKPRNIVFSVDLMYFTGLMFLAIVSRNIRFITALLLAERKKNTIMNAIHQVMKIYQGKGHTIENIEFEEEKEKPIHTLLADNEFQA